MPLKLVLAIAFTCSLGLSVGAQSSSKYLKTLTQEGYTLYFINPISFKQGKARLVPDFTFQHGETKPKVVDIKFSLLTEAPAREMEYLSFHAGENKLGQSEGSELMFLEKAKGRWHARFTTRIPYPTLMEMLQAGDELEIRFHGPAMSLAFPAGKKWRKASEVIREILLAEIVTDK